MIEYKTTLKVIYAGIVYSSFLILFVFNDFEDRRANFLHFNVPAFDFPAADLRGMQMALICSENSENYVGVSECVTNAKEVKAIHPTAIVPYLNYPIIWVDIFSVIGGSRENDVMRMWVMNALLSSLVLLILSFRFNIIILPLILYSPIYLLLIERGNTDGLMLFLTFIPFISKETHPFIKSAAITLAGVLKVFPLFGLLGLLKHKKPYFTLWHLLPIVLLSPLLFITYSQLSIINDVTLKNYFASFGLKSFASIPWIKIYIGNEYLVWGMFFLVAVISARVLYLSEVFRKHFISRYNDNQNDLLQLVLVSFLIISFTSMAASNWAYRLIFIVPAILVLSRKYDVISFSLCFITFVAMWVPLVANGWLIFNYICLFVTIFTLIYILASVPIIFHNKSNEVLS